MAISLAIELHDSLMNGLIEVLWSREGLVSEMMTLQVAPEFFEVVELGRVFRKPLDREPVSPLGKRGASPGLSQTLTQATG
jgi:hypothetical protein